MRAHHRRVGTRERPAIARRFVDLVAVHADDRLLARVDPGLESPRRLADHPLHQAGLHRAVHPARFLDDPHDAEDLGLHLVGEPFDVEAAAERINRIRHAGFFGDDLLCTQGDGHRMFRGQCQCFIK